MWNVIQRYIPVSRERLRRIRIGVEFTIGFEMQVAPLVIRIMQSIMVVVMVMTIMMMLISRRIRVCGTSV